MSPTQIHRWMARCIELAGEGAGSASPNPLVGCVIVGSDGTILGKGAHQEFGGPHAEVHAVAAAEAAGHAGMLESATLFVNLEPCSFHGKTPPCTELIKRKRIPRVVVGVRDPNPRVAGQGIQALREAGVDVEIGVLGHEAARLNEAFIHHTATGRPLVTLKIAQSLDGLVATSSGDSRWISCPDSRHLVHRWRSQLDAVMVGTGTAAEDDPALTVRHVEGRQPWRIVLDRRGRLPADLRLFTDDHVDRTIAVAAEGVRPSYADGLEQAGGHVIYVQEAGGLLDLASLLQILGQPGEERRALLSVMVEGGTRLSTALMGSELVDRLRLFVAPKLVGGGRPSFGDIGTSSMADAYTFGEHHWEHVGEDMLFTGYRRSAAELEELTRP